MTRPNCLIFQEVAFNTKDIWSTRRFVIKPDSFSDLFGITYVVLLSSNFVGAFEVKHFEIPNNSENFDVTVNFSKQIKPKYSKHSVGTLCQNVINQNNGISAKCTFVMDSQLFEEIVFPELKPAVDLKSMKENLKNLYGMDVEVSITLKD